MRKINSWLFFIASRFGSVDYKGRSALTSLLSVLGISFGVTTLIVILSVMNGFQMGYIKSILEVNSYHIRTTATDSVSLNILSKYPNVLTIIPFTDTQTLAQGNYNRQSGLMLRSLPSDILILDEGFASSCEIESGIFSIDESNTIVIGTEVARLLSVSVGDSVELVAIAGGSTTDLFPSQSSLRITGIFKTGYYAIDTSYAFVSEQTAKLLGISDQAEIAGIKLIDSEKDLITLSKINAQFPDANNQTWRTFNRAFFGALRVEKNMMLILVLLIFIVVTVNIYNGMRRSVYERREEISVLTALGGKPSDIRLIFLTNGLGIGIIGSTLGLLLGLLLSVRINSIFSIAEKIVNGINYFISALISNNPVSVFSLFSPEYFYMDSIPTQIIFSEVLLIFLFGVFSASSAAWLASNAILKLKPSEVLRYE